MNGRRILRWFLEWDMKVVPPKTVPYVDLTKYAGKWYEIAAIPQSFEKGCTGTTATFSVPKGDKITVVNQCHEKNLEGPIKEITGKAWSADKKTNSKLKVQFFWPFTSDYWIIDLGSSYEYAVISDPDRETLWILSRTPEMDDITYDGILQRLKDQQYDTTKLKKTIQK